jgi:hypothetical protein
MASKKSVAPTSNPDNIKLDIRHDLNGMTTGMTHSQLSAHLATRSVNSVRCLKKFANVTQETEVSDILYELQKAGSEVVAGDLGRLERMLTNQAITLDAIFNKLAIKASDSEYLKTYEVFMRLAFKAQAQARCTVEALAVLKHPQPYIQTNIGQVGHNQVNNTYATTSSHIDASMQPVAENSKSVQNKLLGADNGNILDIGAESKAGSVNKAMATLD